MKLKKFAVQENIESWQDQLVNFVCSLLCTAHNYTLLESDIRRKAREHDCMRYSYKRKWAWLASTVRQLPYIELVRIKKVSNYIDESEEDNEDFLLAWKLDPNNMPTSAKEEHVFPTSKTSAKEEGEEGAAAATAAECEENEGPGTTHLSWEESIEQQLYRIVSEHPDGILRVELNGMLGIGHKLYNRVVDGLERSKYIVRVAEGVKKSLCYRLFTQENLEKKLATNSELSPTIQSTSTSAAAQPPALSKDSVIEPPPTKKRRRTKVAAAETATIAAAADENNAIKEGAVQLPSLPEAQAQNQQNTETIEASNNKDNKRTKEDTADPKESELKSKAKEAPSSSSPVASTYTSVTTAVATTAADTPSKPLITTRTRCRMVSLERLVNERKIISLHDAGTLLYNMENPGEATRIVAPGERKKTMDRKTLRRVGKLLEQEGIIKHVALTVRLHTGNVVPLEVFYSKEFEQDGPELKEFSRKYVADQEEDLKRKSLHNSVSQKMKRVEIENLPIQRVESLTRIFDNEVEGSCYYGSGDGDNSNNSSQAPNQKRMSRVGTVRSGVILRTKSLFPRTKALHKHIYKFVFGDDGSESSNNESRGASGSNDSSEINSTRSSDSLAAISRVIGTSVVSSIKNTDTRNDGVDGAYAAASSSSSAAAGAVPVEEKEFSINSVVLAMTIKEFKYVCIDTGLDSIPEEYSHDLTLAELPEAVQARILRSNSMKKVNRFLCILARMKLIQPVSIASNVPSDATHMLLGGGSFLDTTTVPAEVRRYSFTDINAVAAYWDDLEYVSRYVAAQRDAYTAAAPTDNTTPATSTNNDTNGSNSTTTTTTTTASNNDDLGAAKLCRRKVKRYLRTLEGPGISPIEGVDELMNDMNWSRHAEKIDPKKRTVLYQHIPSQGQLYLSLTEAKYVARQVRIPASDLFFYQGFLVRRRVRSVEDAQKARVPRHVTAFINRKRNLEAAHLRPTITTETAAVEAEPEPEQAGAEVAAQAADDILDIPVYTQQDPDDAAAITGATATSSPTSVPADFEILKPMRAKFSGEDDKRILMEVVSYCRRCNGGHFTTTWPPHTFDALSYELHKDPTKLEWHISRLLRRTTARNIIEAALALSNAPADPCATTAAGATDAITFGGGGSLSKPTQELPSTIAEFEAMYTTKHKVSPFSRISVRKKPGLTSVVSGLPATAATVAASTSESRTSVAPVLSTLCMISATPKKDYNPNDGYLALSKYSKEHIESAQGALTEAGLIKTKAAEVDDERHITCTDAFAEGTRGLVFSKKVFEVAGYYKQCATVSEDSLTIGRNTDPGVVWESLLFAENGVGALTPLFSPSPSAKSVSSAAATMATTASSSSSSSSQPIPRCGVLRHIISMQNPAPTAGTDPVEVPSWSKRNYKLSINNFHSNERFCVEFGFGQVTNPFEDTSADSTTAATTPDTSGDEAVPLESCDDALRAMRQLGMYSEAELLHCQHLIDAFRAAGVGGLSATSASALLTTCRCREEAVNTDVCLQALANFGVVVRVPDVMDIKYVLHEHASHWLLQRVPPEQRSVPFAGLQQLPDAHKWVPLQPWMHSDGSLNNAMIEAAQNRIVCLVARHPGIEERKLCTMLPFTQGTTLFLLEALEAENRVRKTTVVTQDKPTLLSNLLPPRPPAHV